MVRMTLGVSLLLAALAAAEPAAAEAPQASPPGRSIFETRCARCHGGDGNGGEMGPAIAQRLTTRDNAQLATLMHAGIPMKGMPPSDVTDAETADLVDFLRTIERRAESAPIVRRQVQTTGGATFDGRVMAEGFNDLQLLTDDQRVHLLRRDGDRFRDGDVGRRLADLQRRAPAATATPR